MKNLLRVSAFVSLLMIASIAAFSQKTCEMKFRVHEPLSALDPPFYANFYLIDTSIPSCLEKNLVPLQVFDNQINTYLFISPNPSSFFPVYKYYVEVWDSNGHQGSGWSVSFNASDYVNKTIPVDIINLE